MYRRAMSMIAAGIWAMALSAQAPPAAAARQESCSPEEMAVCSIPLTEAHVTKNVERMPTLRPRAEPDNIDPMPSVKLPAPPCKEEKR